MPQLRLTRFAALCLAALAACNSDGPEAASPAPAPIPVETGAAASESAAALALANGERTSRGLVPLTLDPRLAQAAARHTADMAATGQLGHQGSDGSSMADRIRAAGYAFCGAAENVGVGYADAADVTRGWMGSPGHRANILTPTLTQGAVAEQVGTDGRRYWTMVLAAPC